MAGDLTILMEPVARELWGDPNPALSSKTELRYGTHGARVVRPAMGVWADHEKGHASINAGGVLALIARETGCDAMKGAFDWLRAHHYEVDDARPESAPNGHAKTSTPGKEVAHYDYVDESGGVLFQVVRFEPKTFRQRKPDGKGGWLMSVKGVRPVPYRLPEIIEHIGLDHAIAIVEGEKDADRLWALGIPATCNAGGANKWSADLCEFFHDADVVIVQDNDDPGRDHAQDVARQLSAVAKRVRVLDLAKHWPEMPAKGDVADWLKDGGGTAGRLHALIADTVNWSPALAASKFGGVRWEDIGRAGLTASYHWLVEDVVPMGEIVLLFGESGSGKSFDAFDMAMANARGLMWNGFNTEPGLTVYVAAEAGKGFGKRKQAYISHHGLDPAKPLPLYLMTKRPNFFSSDDDVNALVIEIRALLPSYTEPLVAIYLDTLSALTPGMNENASQDVSMVRMRLERLRMEFGVSVILVHHKPKGGSTPRGHGSLTGDFETTIEFETMSDRKDSYGRPVHRATVRKQREGKSGLMWQFTLPVVEVGRNKWGNPETSCVVVPFEPGVKVKGGFRANSNELLFMQALFEALDEHATPPPGGLPRSITKAVDFKHVREAMRARMIDPDGDERAQQQRFRTAFSRAGKTLRDAKVIGVKEPLVWPSGKPVQGLSTAPVEMAPPMKGDDEGHL